jgi:hypothetical protein
MEATPERDETSILLEIHQWSDERIFWELLKIKVI